MKKTTFLIGALLLSRQLYAVNESLHVVPPHPSTQIYAGKREVDVDYIECPEQIGIPVPPQMVKQIEEAYEKANEDNFFEWEQSTKDLERLASRMPQEAWIQ